MEDDALVCSNFAIKTIRHDGFIMDRTIQPAVADRLGTPHPDSFFVTSLDVLLVRFATYLRFFVQSKSFRLECQILVSISHYLLINVQDKQQASLALVMPNINDDLLIYNWWHNAIKAIGINYLDILYGRQGTLLALVATVARCDPTLHQLINVSAK